MSEWGAEVVSRNGLVLWPRLVCSCMICGVVRFGVLFHTMLYNEMTSSMLRRSSAAVLQVEPTLWAVRLSRSKSGNSPNHKQQRNHQDRL